MLNKNNFVCYVGTARFIMPLAIPFVAFKWPGVLDAVISEYSVVSQLP